ncbi:LysR family transcriptional regulator [Paramixta manurensis]|uniref:LysR family transcriptional regulator n=1 Tax=Paramixta manurensis TaxID=2740817 RepID=A0A6M8U9B0_9GAMM|nr:LysR family transcriptional regulator [Erwiniaceae bacterium PD-1]
MDRLDGLTLFVRIVETGSFSRAADMLAIPRATATYAIQQLEARLSTQLLERTTRQVRPTLDGQAFYERCVAILSDIDDAESSLRHVAANPRGTLRVDMSGTHAMRIVLPHIEAFHQRYPEIMLAVSSGDRLVDLVREGVDCVIRAGHPRDSTLVVRRLALMPQVICASPAYLAAAGVLNSPGDLAQHQVVGFMSGEGVIDYSIDLINGGKTESFTASGWMAVNDAENYVVSALSGAGLIQLPRFHVEQALREGRLVEVLEGWQSPPMPLSILYPWRRHLSPRLRVFIDWLIDVYRQRLPE